MVEYFRSDVRPFVLVRRLLQIAALFVLFSMATSLCAFAQNGAARTNSAQAVLHIRVNIVSIVMAPPAPEPRLTPIIPVAYNIPGAKSNVEMIEETRPFVPPGTGQIGTQGAVLKTTTIVLR